MMRFRDFSLSRTMAADLLPSCPKRHFLKNEILLFKDDPGDEVFYVERGQTKAISFGADGKSLFFADFEPGDIFGYYATFTKKPRTTTIVGHSEGSVAIIPAQKFIEFVTGRPEYAEDMMRYLASHLRMNSLRLSRNSTLAAPERIAAYLGFCLEETNSPIIDIPSREDFASQLDITRETLSRILNKMAQDRLIEIGTHSIKIIDPAALYRFFSRED